MEKRQTVRKSKPVAAYMRMSSAGQAGSIPTQRSNLQRYARRHRMTIIKEYIDAGRSGLTIQQRKGLQALIQDITSGSTVEFKAVLVNDVNRWGRFPNLDESAHYEILCKHAGVNVIYCEEIFTNDGSIESSVMKTLRRFKAADEIRELSVKVFAGQARLAKLGYKQGGRPGYGLRRASVHKVGKFRRLLEPGERKSAVSDRVIFVPGPDEEIQVVRRIYDMYVNQNMGDQAIARMLNADEIVSELGGVWTGNLVHRILVSPKYIGTVAYNRKSKKLQGPTCVNPSTQWVLKRNAFPSLIELDLFERAQELRRCRADRYTREELLEMLRSVYLSNGKITGRLVRDDTRMPPLKVFRTRFETLSKAYELAGIPSTEHAAKILQLSRAIEKIRNDTIVEVCSCVACLGGGFEIGPLKNTFYLNGNIVVRIEVAAPHRKEGNCYHWIYRLHRPQDTQFVIGIQLAALTYKIEAFYLFPAMQWDRDYIRIAASRQDNFKQYRFGSIQAMFGL